MTESVHVLNGACVLKTLQSYLERICLFIYLFICTLTYNLDCVALVIVMVNWTGCGRKQLWPNLRYYTGICLEQLRKTIGFLVFQAVCSPVISEYKL
jgi:hypothetical protein